MLNTSTNNKKRGRNIAHFGLARPGTPPGGARAGGVASEAMRSGKGNYLANLVLYPGACAGGVLE